jgi:hypothetical protein
MHCSANEFFLFYHNSAVKFYFPIVPQMNFFYFTTIPQQKIYFPTILQHNIRGKQGLQNDSRCYKNSAELTIYLTFGSKMDQYYNMAQGSS